MNRSSGICYCLVSRNVLVNRLEFFALIVLLCNVSLAGVFVSGDVQPTNPLSWGTNTDAYVGKTGVGQLVVSDGSSILSYRAYVGYESGSSGAVTIDGIGSKWSVVDLNVGNWRGGTGVLDIINGGIVEAECGSQVFNSRVTVEGAGSIWKVGSLGGYDYDVSVLDGGRIEADDVGLSGHFLVDGVSSHLQVDYWLNIDSGELDIKNGGVVSVSRATEMNYWRKKGKLRFDNGVLNTGSILFGINDVSGSGVINTHGIVGDIDLLFDSVHGPTQKIYLNRNAGQNIEINLSVDGNHELGIGYRDLASMRIADGRVIESGYADIGYNEEGVGIVTVDGVGTKWKPSDVEVGRRGTGVLNIVSGGQVETGECIIGARGVESSRGIVTVDGAGSQLSVDYLNVGSGGKARVSIINGAQVIAHNRTWTQVEVNKIKQSVINFDNGRLTTGDLLCGVSELEGVGVIDTHGLVSDVDLVFDATHGLNTVVHVNRKAGQDITVNLDVDGSGAMGAGWLGNGSLRIADGVVVKSKEGYLGHGPDSYGLAIISGMGSRWENDGGLKIGNWLMSGRGRLEILSGGQVISGTGSLNRGYVLIDGQNSKWNADGPVGMSIGTMNITNGGQLVSGGEVYIGVGYDSNVKVTVAGDNSQLIVRSFHWFDEKSLFVGGYTYGWNAKGILNILDGGYVESEYVHIGMASDSSGLIKVSGDNSELNAERLIIGSNIYTDEYGHGRGLLRIFNDGLVKADYITMDMEGNSDDFIDMGSGGMLALLGQADGSIGDFLDLFEGNAMIRYWNDSLSAWSSITNAIANVDYTLSYVPSGDLAGYTVLTVNAVPEPVSLILFVIAAILILNNNSRKEERFLQLSLNVSDNVLSSDNM